MSRYWIEGRKEGINMAEYYNANEVELSIEKQLKICNWKKVNDKYFEIELPVVLYFNYQRLILYIYIQWMMDIISMMMVNHF